jgi:hypothetical protein
LSFLGPHILISSLFSNALNLCSSLDVRDQVSRPHRTKGKTGKSVIYIYSILIFAFWDSGQEYKTFWTAWMEAFPKFGSVLSSLWMTFGYVTAISKYLVWTILWFHHVILVTTNEYSMNIDSFHYD